LNGWNGKILWIDLTSGKVHTESIDETICHDFIGGKGVGTYLLARELRAGIDPLGPDNILFFLAGPLQGLPGPSVGRWTLVTKSPLTGLYLDTHSGGPLGREIKKAGFDAIAVRGVSDSPVTIAVEDDSVSIDSATDLWGLGTQEATRRLHEATSKSAAVYVIGPSGEKQIRVAMGCCELAHQTGRGGAGAVLGSKNLKGLVVKGTGKIEAHDIKEMRRINASLAKTWNEKVDYGFKDFGTGFLVELANERGQYPAYNWRSGHFKGYEGLDAALMEEKWGLGAHQSCPHCVMRCTRAFRTEDASNPGHEVESTVEYETLGLLGGNIGVNDPQAVLRLNYLCDDLGIDTISTGSIVGFAMEAFERGILTEKDIGFPLKFGDAEAALRLVRMIAEGRGIGELLSQGVKKASEEIGEGTSDFAVHVKGLETPAWDPRGRRGLGISYATADVGASHLRGWPQLVEFPGEPAVDVMDSFLGHRDLKIMVDSLVICHFTYHIPVEYDVMIQLLNAATGLEYTREDGALFGQRVETLSRLFNIREGISRVDDRLPKRFWEPEADGPAEGKKAFTDERDFETALEKYYSMRGWDSNGVPTTDTLKQLGLKPL